LIEATNSLLLLRGYNMVEFDFKTSGTDPSVWRRALNQPQGVMHSSDCLSYAWRPVDECQIV